MTSNTIITLLKKCGLRRCQFTCRKITDKSYEVTILDSRIKFDELSNRLKQSTLMSDHQIIKPYQDGFIIFNKLNLY